jgi:hypothetical protein
MVDSNYKLSLDSINSDVNLSFDKYKTYHLLKKIIMMSYHIL